MKEIASAFLVKPLEPIYFGGPSSFGAGEKHIGNSEFPPSPFTFQGLVRSHLLRSVQNPTLDLNDWSSTAKEERQALVGGPDTLPDGWQIQGAFPAIQEKMKTDAGIDEISVSPWVCVPRFLLSHDNGPIHTRPVATVHPGMNDLEDKSSADKLLLLGRPEKNVLSTFSGWIGPENLLFALAGEGNKKWHPEQYAEHLPPFIKNESQPGVAIDQETSMAKPSQLYNLKSLRFGKNAGMAGWFTGHVDNRVSENQFLNGAASVGRKGRLAHFERITQFHADWETVINGKHLPEKVSENDTFWLLCITPVRMETPLMLDLNSHLPSGMSFIVRGALTGPPVYLGGYQMATGRSRYNKPYLPGGSAWLFQLKGGDPEERAVFLRQLNNTNKLGPSEEAKFGFGHTLVGIGPQI